MPVPHFSLGAFLDRGIIEVKHDAPRKPLHCGISIPAISALGGEFNESTQHLLILADEEVCEWRGMHGPGSRRNRRPSCGSAGRAVNVWRTSRERLRGG